MRNIKIQGWIYYLLNLWIIKNQLDKKLWETWKYKVEYIFEFLFFFFLDCKSSRAIFVQWVWWGRQSLNHQLFGIIQWFCQKCPHRRPYLRLLGRPYLFTVCDKVCGQTIFWSKGPDLSLCEALGGKNC